MPWCLMAAKAYRRKTRHTSIHAAERLSAMALPSLIALLASAWTGWPNAGGEYRHRPRDSLFATRMDPQLLKAVGQGFFRTAAFGTAVYVWRPPYPFGKIDGRKTASCGTSLFLRMRTSRCGGKREGQEPPNIKYSISRKMKKSLRIIRYLRTIFIPDLHANTRCPSKGDHER